MATFREGDWVQITPTADKRWEHWTDVHTDMTSHIGVIDAIQQDDVDPSVTYVSVSLLDKVGDPFTRAWFLEKHIIKSSKYDHEMGEDFKRACDELQEWEEMRRKLLDESLRRTFGIADKKKVRRPKKKTNLASSTKDSQAQLVDGWEEVTDEILLEDAYDDISIDDIYASIAYPDGTD